MALPELWNIEDVEIGDYLAVEFVCENTNSEFHGGRTAGFVVEITPSHKQAKLSRRWWAHTHDRIIKHIPAAEASIAACPDCGKATEYDRIGKTCFACHMKRYAERKAQCKLGTSN